VPAQAGILGLRMIDVKVLRAAGISDRQILDALEIEQTERIARRREQNRINKQNQRSRQQLVADGADGADGADKNGSFFLTSSLDSEIHKKEGSKKDRVARARKLPLSDDWCSQDEHSAYVRKEHPEFSKTQVAQTVDDASDTMRHWARAGGHKRADWNAQLYVFLKPKGGNGHEKSHRRGNGLGAAADRAIARLESEIGADETGQGAFRLLPTR
jgi:hypothetical protein